MAATRLVDERAALRVRARERDLPERVTQEHLAVSAHQTVSRLSTDSDLWRERQEMSYIVGREYAQTPDAVHEQSKLYAE